MTQEARDRGRVRSRGRRAALFGTTKTHYTFNYLCAIATSPPLVQKVTKTRTDRRRIEAISWRNIESRGHCRVSGLGAERDLCAFYADLTQFANLCLNEHVMQHSSVIPKHYNKCHHCFKVVNLKILSNMCIIGTTGWHIRLFTNSRFNANFKACVYS